MRVPAFRYLPFARPKSDVYQGSAAITIAVALSTGTINDVPWVRAPRTDIFLVALLFPVTISRSIARTQRANDAGSGVGLTSLSSRRARKPSVYLSVQQSHVGGIRSECMHGVYVSENVLRVRILAEVGPARARARD